MVHLLLSSSADLFYLQRARHLTAIASATITTIITADKSPMAMMMDSNHNWWCHCMASPSSYKNHHH